MAFYEYSWIHHESIQRNFTALHIPLLNVRISFPLPHMNPWQPLIFPLSLGLWNYTACSLFIVLISINNTHSNFLHNFHDLIAHFFLLLSNILFYGYIIFVYHPFIYNRTADCFQFGTILNKTAINTVQFSADFCWHKFSAPLGKYLRA
jgi:hypothetical protein